MERIEGVGGLALVPTDELIDEVKRRYDGLVLIASRRLVGAERGEYIIRHKGDPFEKLGLVEFLSLHMGLAAGGEITESAA